MTKQTNIELSLQNASDAAQDFSKSLSETEAKMVGKGVKLMTAGYHFAQVLRQNDATFQKFMTEANGFLKATYSDDEFYTLLFRWLLTKAGVKKIPSGSVSRISTICRFAEAEKIGGEHLADLVVQFGGFIATYNVARKGVGGDKVASNDNYDWFNYQSKLVLEAPDGQRWMLNIEGQDILRLVKKNSVSMVAAVASNDNGATSKGDDDDHPPTGNGGNPATIPDKLNGIADPDIKKWEGFTYASFFACGGGADYGLEQAGGQLIYANEVRKQVAEVFELNHGVKVDVRSITDTAPTDYKNPLVMVGGFPCQPFSSAGKGQGENDPRGTLGIDFAERIVATKPAAFILENVPRFLRNPAFTGIRKKILGILEGDYIIASHVFNAADYGVAQTRERAFIIGYRKDLGIAFHSRKMARVSTWRTLRDAIGDLDGMGKIWTPECKGKPLTGHEITKCEPNRFLSQSSDIRNWNEPSQTVISTQAAILFHPENLPEEMAGQPGVYFHEATKTYHRRLSIREMARIQGFPDSFKLGNASIDLAYDMIGNAIPPLLMKAVAEVVRDDLAQVGLITPVYGELAADQSLLGSNDNTRVKEAANG